MKSSLNPAQLDELVSQLSYKIVDGMDTQSLEQYVYETLHQMYEVCSEEELKDEIKEIYDNETLEEMLDSVKTVRHLSVVSDVNEPA